MAGRGYAGRGADQYIGRSRVKGNCLSAALCGTLPHLHPAIGHLLRWGRLSQDNSYRLHPCAFIFLIADAISAKFVAIPLLKS